MILTCNYLAKIYLVEVLSASSAILCVTAERSSAACTNLATDGARDTNAAYATTKITGS